VVGVSIDQDISKWKEAIVKDGLNWTEQVVEPAVYSGDLIQFYEIKGIPTSVLIDKEGKIVQFDISVNQVKYLMRNNR